MLTIAQAGLFSAVTATIASMTIADLKPDPNDTTQALLQNIWLSLNHTDGLSLTPIPLPDWEGPPISVIWVQSFLYASLACSLFAALGAVLGKQWLSRYGGVGERGAVEDRCKDRQRKFDGLRNWHFRRILEALPVLLQLSLLLFALALSAFMWSQQRVVAIVVIAANSIGGLFYLSVMGVSLYSADSPFHTPLSDIIHNLTVNIFRLSGKFRIQLENSPTRKACKESVVATFNYVWRFFSFVAAKIPGSVRLKPEPAAPLSMADQLPEGSSRGLRGGKEHATDIEANTELSSLDEFGGSRALRQSAATSRITRLGSTLLAVMNLHLRSRRSASGSFSDAAAMLWLLQTTTDPVVRADTLQAAPFVQWPAHLFKDFCTGERLDLLLQQLFNCFQTTSTGFAQLPPSHQPRAISVCAAVLFLYWELRVLDGEKARRWVTESGIASVAEHSNLVGVLSRFRPKQVKQPDDKSRPHDHEIILYFTFITLTVHWKETMKTTPIIGYSNTTMSMETLQARTQLYLAQVSRIDSWDSTQINFFLGNFPLDLNPGLAAEESLMIFNAHAASLGYRLQLKAVESSSSRLTSVE